MKFRCKTADLTAALSLVSIVPPREVMPGAGAGYLLTVRGERCYIYSRDTTCVTRADFPISEVEGEGPFTFPAGLESIMREEYIGETCEFETLADGDNCKVSYLGSSGAKLTKMMFNPQLLSPCDTDLEKARKGEETFDFPSGLLRESLSLSRSFYADVKDGRAEEQFKAIQIFDKNKPDQARGDGYLYCANSIQVYYFQCEAFVGKHLEIHGMHLSLFEKFLSQSEGNVSICRGDNFLFAINSKGQVFGWPRQVKKHEKFTYFSLKGDQFILKAPKSAFQKALTYTRATLDPKRDKIKIRFDHMAKQLQLNVADGSTQAAPFPIPMEVEKAEERDIIWNANIDHFKMLVDGVKGNEVVLRVTMTMVGEREVALFRTIDEFRMTPEGKVVTETEGTFQCRVTRYSPSRD